MKTFTYGLMMLAAFAYKDPKDCKETPVSSYGAKPVVVPVKQPVVAIPVANGPSKQQLSNADKNSVQQVLDNVQAAVANGIPSNINIARNPDGSISVAGIRIPANLVNNPKAAIRHAIDIIPRPATNNFEQDCINLNNAFRKLMGLKEYTRSPRLTSVAQNWANQLASTNSFRHSSFGNGENLYSTTGGDQSCGAAIVAWMKEIDAYASGMRIGSGNFASYGHFTQLMSSLSTEVGCASAVNGRTRVTVCEYSPPGNMVGTSINIKLAV
ncbi:hypothetical protein HDV02_001017 [Globomyces sp. JEL0801]|nr:hypothetical protein HDV02_001017 [Globomyces sp. JEL0801]